MAHVPYLRLENGKLAIWQRSGIFQARIYLGNGKYLPRSLHTGNKIEAIKLGKALYAKVQFKVEYNIPIQEKKFLAIINEYVEYREDEHAAGRTKIGMLRQVRRVSHFWKEYAGHLNVTAIDDTMLDNYVDWRRKYYYDPCHPLPQNGKLNPTDKTLQWEIMLGKAILKWATKKGYRKGCDEITWSFVPKVKRIRPAFEITEYRQLIRGLITFCSKKMASKHQSTYFVLRDYVLVLSNSGIRVGEANSLRYRDLQPFTDSDGRQNYRLMVNGKTGLRDVIPRLNAYKFLNRVLARNPNAQPDDYVFSINNGKRIITLEDQFKKILAFKGISNNSKGEPFTLYSLRHFYAVQALRKGIDIYTVARNMGTSVEMIQQYYGKQATPFSMAAKLGGPIVTSSRTTAKPAMTSQIQLAAATPTDPAVQTNTTPSASNLPGSSISTLTIPIPPLLTP